MATFHNSLLFELLNDDTFVAWIEGDNYLSKSDKIKWDKWLEDSPNHARIVKHAKKIVEMPFNDIKVDCNFSGELDRLLKKINQKK